MKVDATGTRDEVVEWDEKEEEKSDNNNNPLGDLRQQGRKL